jgi:hypothetical protein
MTTGEPAVDAAAPEPLAAPPAEDEPDVDHDRSLAAESDPAPAAESPGPQLDYGTPAGQLAAGACFVAVLGGWALYNAGGWLWVAIAGGALVALALVYVLARYRLPGWLRSERSTGRASRSGGAKGGWRLGRGKQGRASTGGARTAVRRGAGGRGLGLRALLPTRKGGASSSSKESGGRRGSRNRGRGEGARRGAAAVRRVRQALRSLRPGRRGGSAAGQGKGKGGRTGRADRKGRAERAGRAVRAAASRMTRAWRWLDAKTGGRASRAAAAVRGNRFLQRLLTRLRSWDQRLTDGAAAAFWQRLRRPHASADPELTIVPTEAANALISSAATTRSFATTGRGTTAMTDFSLVTHATELPTVAASYESDDMMDVRGHMTLLRELPLAAGTAVRIWTERLAADYPLEQQASEALQRVYDAFGAVVEACDEASVTFEGVHEADIQRRLQPRTNEHKWNDRSHSR